MSSKRVLVVCQHFWPENFRINDICDFLLEKGCEIDVLCGIPNYPQGKFYAGYSYLNNRKQSHNGINIRRALEIPRGTNTNFRIFLNYISFPIASLFHVPYLLTKKYDKVLVFTYSPIMMAIAGIIVGKIKKIEITLYALDLWPENLFSVLKIKNNILRTVIKHISHWHYKRADKIIAASDKMRNKLIEVTNIDPENITVMPQACEKIYEKKVHDKSLSSRFLGKFNILFTGNISPAQSFETILDAATHLKNSGLTDLRWIIVGDGMSRNWLVQEVKSRKLEDSFVFEGLKPIEEIPKYTAIADVLVGCLVKSELLEASIPAKVTSYLASGKPMVVAMDGEANKLVNIWAKCGYAGPTENSVRLAENIKKIYQLPLIERQKMGERGRAYHFGHYERNLVYGNMYNFIFR